MTVYPKSEMKKNKPKQSHDLVLIFKYGISYRLLQNPNSFATLKISSH